MEEFIGYRKIPRFSREIIITEKLDGTNGQVYITDAGEILAGSRKRWITPDNDNHGFAKWVEANKEELITGLGPGRHYGEWWGQGINRGYGLKEKRFSLFNLDKWEAERPACCGIVPRIYKGDFTMDAVEAALYLLATLGSIAAPGFMRPEGIVILHKAGGYLFKKTIENDEKPKGVEE